MADLRSELPVICIASSALQLAAFRASGHSSGDVIVVGGRGTPGDVTYRHSIINDASFIPDFERMIGGKDVEIFIPHSLSLLYFFGVVSKHVRRISFVDEGGLTKRYLAGGDRKPEAPDNRRLTLAMRSALLLPEALRNAALWLISRYIQRVIVRRYVRDPGSYPYRTIERRVKPGIVLSHIRHPEHRDWVQFVDISSGLHFSDDYSGWPCVFLHPKNLANGDLARRMQGELRTGDRRLLIRPHPMFHLSQDRLEEFMRRLEQSGVSCQIAQLTEKQDVAIELYARGVRTFYCGESSILDTVEAYEEFFSELQVVKI